MKSILKFLRRNSIYFSRNPFHSNLGDIDKENKMANSHFDNELMRFLQQTAEYFEFDEIDHAFSRQSTANDDTYQNIYNTYNYIQHLTTVANKNIQKEITPD